MRNTPKSVWTAKLRCSCGAGFIQFSSITRADLDAKICWHLSHISSETNGDVYKRQEPCNVRGFFHQPICPQKTVKPFCIPVLLSARQSNGQSPVSYTHLSGWVWCSHCKSQQQRILFADAGRGAHHSPHHVQHLRIISVAAGFGNGNIILIQKDVYKRQE